MIQSIGFAFLCVSGVSAVQNDLMELDFDKEIDALIRREAAGRTITISERSGLHLDADEIAAFAEGAVPERARNAFILHFAECDSCRKILSNAIAINAEEVPAAVAGVAAPAIEAAMPWYRRLFLFPNLAYVMGGLVVLFAGFIGLSILTTTYRSGQSEVSTVSNQGDRAASEAQPAVVAPFANTNSSLVSSADAASNNANTATNIPSDQAGMIPVANTASNAAVAKQAPATAPSADEDKLKDVQTNAPPPAPPAKNENFAVDGLSTRRVEELRAAPAPERDVKAEPKAVAQATPMPRSGPMAKMKGPLRNDARERGIAIEAEKQDSTKNVDSALAGTRTTGKKSVAGRVFEFKQGAWYDTTYRGQGTINVRRNTDDYRKLDRGLRGIAESFIGTVVVTIWNGRAYRIQ